jgi:HKD family nuclease
MSILNQPFDSQLGDIIISKLEEDCYTKFTIFSAFAKNSGVLRLKPAMEHFSQQGGYIEAFIGIDLYGTSYEALLNLFNLCDALYIIHSENPATTFHSKIYTLSDDTKTWFSIGSNNFTSGGLWTNFESANCFEVNNADSTAQEYNNSLNRLIAHYSSNAYECSKKITSENDLIELLEADYIRSEVRIQMLSINRRRNIRNGITQTPLFGTQAGVQAPRIQRVPTGAIIHPPRNAQPVQATEEIVETNASERIWFETRAMTGGSRNILYLSKLGSISGGSAAGSRYETDNSEFMLGGIAFFDIDPEDGTISKDITINYNGIDYTPCTIKFAPDNGSWRIQLRGQNSDGTIKLHKVHGDDWMRFKIMIFEKIRTDYYSLSVLEEDQIENLKSQSYVVARNGSGRNSKLFGLL